MTWQVYDCKTPMKWSLCLTLCKFIICDVAHEKVPNLKMELLSQWYRAGMLILVLVLKDSLRTFSSPCPCPGFLGSGPCPCPGPWGSGPCPCPGPCGSSPCPYPGPCGLVLVLVHVFSPCKDLFPLFHYCDLFAYHCSVIAYN